MVQDVIQFLRGIGDFFVSIGNFITDFVKDLVYIIKITGEALAALPSYFDWLPKSFVVVLITIFGIVVIYKISGREG